MSAENETIDWLNTLESAALSDINAYSYGYAIKGDSVSGTLSPVGDVDLIRIPMAAQETYRLTLTGADASFILIDDSYLFGDNKPVLASPGSDGAISWTAVHPSAHYFAIVSGSGSYTLGVDGIVADSLPDDAGNDSTTTATLALNQTVGGIINGRNTTADVDWYAVDLTAGSSYHWQMTPTNSMVGATAGGLLNLYDAAGTPLTASATWSGSAWIDGASLEYTATTGGRYFIEAQPYGFNESGSYLLSMSDPAVGLPAPVLTLQGSTLVEPDAASAQATITFTLDQSATASVVANYQTLSGSASAGADYTAASGTVTFAPGETSKSITVNVLSDSVSEASETFYVQITSVSGAQLSPTSGIFDEVTISDSADNTQGSGAADALQGNAGNDTIDGGGGIDTLTYPGNRADFSLARSGATLIVTDNAGNQGSDSVSNVERLVFADTKLALDVDGGNAGIAAKILGSVFGASAVTGESYSKQYVGIGLGYLDNGTSYQNLMQLALDVKLGAGFSTADEVRLFYQNLAGITPSADDLAYYVNLVDAGQYTQASLGVMAADLDLNASNIGLVGLAHTGIEFI